MSKNFGELSSSNKAQVKAPPAPENLSLFQDDSSFTRFSSNADHALSTSSERGQHSPRNGVKVQDLEITKRGRRRSEFNLELNERDYNILEILYEQGGVTRRDIIDYLKNKMSVVGAIRRLRVLRNSNLITEQKVITHEIETAILLSYVGYKLMRERVGYHLPFVRNLKPKTSRHNLAISTVRLALEKRFKEEGFSIEYVSEKILKKELYLEIPDGILKLNPGQKQIAIEVENTLKSRKRLCRLFERWAKIDIALVLYVSTTEGIHRSLIKLIQNLKYDHLPIAFITLNELSSANPIAQTLRGPLPLFKKDNEVSE